MPDTSTNLATAALTFSVLSFLLLVVVVIFTMFPDFAATLKAGASLGATSSSMGGFKVVGALLGAFSPDIAILSGFISDIMSGSFRFSVTSFISIITVILHWGIARLIYGANPASPSAAAEAVKAVTAAVAPTAPVLPGTATLLGTGAPGSEFTATGERGLVAPAAPRASALTGTGVASSGIFGRKNRALAGLGPAIPGARPSRKVTLNPGPPGSSVSRGAGMTGGAISLSGINPLAIRGLGMFDVAKSPMGMAALTSIFTVYLLDMYVGDKRSKTETGVFLLFSSVVYGLNLFAYKEFGLGDTYGAVAKATMLPVIVGLVGGASGYAVLNTQYPSFLPLDGQPIGSPASPGGSAGPRCNAPNDKDQFVCDAYKDGKRISTATVG